MKKINILNVIGSLSKGGAEYQCALLSNKLNSKQFSSKVICFYKGPSPHYEDLDNIIFIPRGGKWNIISLFKRIHSVVRSENPDILHVWLPEIISVPAALIGKFLGIPVVASHRNSTKFSGDMTKYIRDRVRFIQYIFATKIISNFYVKEEPAFFRFLYRLKNGVVIFNGLKEIPQQDEQDQKFGNKSSNLLFVGRLAPEKNLPTLLKSLELLKQEGEVFGLKICGEGNDNYKSKLKDLINDLGISDQVEFLGYKKNWHSLASSSLCLLLPSRSEGTANVVLEALSMRLPVIMSNIPMSRSLLNHEINALIVESNDPQKWAKNINRLSKSEILVDRLKRNGFDYSKTFSITNMVSQYEECYKQITMVNNQ